MIFVPWGCGATTVFQDITRSVQIIESGDSLIIRVVMHENQSMNIFIAQAWNVFRV